MARNLLKPRKHAISAYRNDICILHRTTDCLATVLELYAREVEKACALGGALAHKAAFGFGGDAAKDQTLPDHVVLWKGKARKTAFAEFDLKMFHVEQGAKNA